MSDPKSIIDQLEELKLWQEAQQQKLLQEQEAQRERLLSQQRRDYEALGLSFSSDNLQIEPENSEGPSPRASLDFPMEGVSSISEIDVDDDSSMSEVEVLPEPLKKTDDDKKEKDSTKSNADPKPKRPFLRRGAGLIKYNMNLSDCKLSNLPKYKFAKPIQPKSARKSLFRTPAQPSQDKDQLRPNPDVQQVSETKCHTDMPSSTDKQNPEQCWANVLNKEPVQEKLNDSLLNPEEKQDTMDLQMFELLEQNANNSSFCSTSSLVTKFLNNKPVNIYEKKDGFSASDSNPYVQKPRVRFDDKVQVQDETSTTETELHSYGDLSSITSSCTSTPNTKHTSYPESCGDMSEDSTLQSESDYHKRRSTTTSEINIDVIQNPETHNPGVMILQQNKMLKERLQELENEIALFRKRNVELTRSREEFELQKESFEMYKSQVEQNLKLDKLEYDNYITDERYKLLEEKKLFDKMTYDFKRNPNRKEREEIAALKEKIMDLQTEIRSKDAKSGASTARLRTHVKKLEAENDKHMKSIEELKEKNKKLLLANNKYRKSANKKMLQEIQSNLPQLLEENLASTASDEKDSPEQGIGTSKSIKKGYFSESSSDDEATDVLKKEVVMIDQETMTDFEYIATKSQETDTSDVQAASKSEGTDDFVARKVHKSIETDYFDYAAFKKMQASRVKALEQEIASTSHPKPRLVEDSCKYPSEFMRAGPSSTDTRNPLSISNVPPKLDYCYKSDLELMERIERQIPNITIHPETECQEIRLPDGSTEVWFANGTVKKTSADGFTKIIFFNGDRKDILPTGTVIYFYASTQVKHTTFADGSELLEEPR